MSGIEKVVSVDLDMRNKTHGHWSAENILTAKLKEIETGGEATQINGSSLLAKDSSVWEKESETSSVGDLIGEAKCKHPGRY